MKEYDSVEVIVEKENYAKEGVHKGMTGFIMNPRCINGKRLVIIDSDLHQDPISGIWYSTDIDCSIREVDLEVIRESHHTPL